MLEYKQYKTLDPQYVLERIQYFLKEDIPNGDKTTIGTVNSSEKSVAEIQAVEKLIFSGQEVIPYCFGNDIQVTLFAKDGDEIMPGDKIGKIIGNSIGILSRERVMLNLIQRLCGIATQSNLYSKLAKPYNVKILDTRKTTPGLRLLEKYAVACGGCYNHRMNLSEGILIKDNHIVAAGSIKSAVTKIRKKNFNLTIELEVDNINQIKQGLRLGVKAFLLDNMDLVKIMEAIGIIREFPYGNEIFIEASGGITTDNIQGYLETGVNAISIGALTHQIKSKDIRLEFI